MCNSYNSVFFFNCSDLIVSLIVFFFKTAYLFLLLWKSFFLILFFFFLVNAVLLTLSKSIMSRLNISSTGLNLFKGILVCEFLICFIFIIVMLYLYIYIYTCQSLVVNNAFFSMSDVTFFNLYPITLDLFGLVIFFLAVLVGFLAVLTIDGRLKKINWNYLVFFNYFLISVYFLVSFNNFFLIFLAYEMLLIPSFFLIYNLSYVKKAIQASFYFLIWTQFGSLIVLSTLTYVYVLTGSSDLINVKLFKFTTAENQYILAALFLGFGLKVPVWPFHYWLTKVHVEAPSSFSIYLSGFLVKTALFSFFKISLSLSLVQVNYYFFIILIMGIVDSSLKFWGQQDIKKLVAYCTIQEMNLIFIFFIYGDSNLVNCGIFFCVVHAIMSSLMFFLVECIFKRFNSRSIIVVNGILQRAPNLGAYIFLLCIFYSGIPFTAKFSCELYLFSSVFSSFPVFFFIIIIATNFIGIVGFSRVWFNAIFCYNNVKTFKVQDLSLKEHYFISFCFLFLTIINYGFFLIF